ncbi:hypothetical protein SODALDRAFT_361665 [Sodiomyces alkalinus F11]|uniref:Uncharacterized protein n=1 Tax=Sodiomyces alkalinus (strain CBS 110278 / VKM F-3762 / F11) TaxID=1314773 RepID=A0A3N2PQR0_SODAK|nr:hypothetical protein SODALDRAFT_361665 [Sodiomyces alkalinus F11]ROT36843.1 hypothetical protein SODALDRAFT_361665 [Sodiomyces alkalinus F11]
MTAAFLWYKCFARWGEMGDKEAVGWLGWLGWHERMVKGKPTKYVGASDHLCMSEHLNARKLVQ